MSTPPKQTPNQRRWQRFKANRRGYVSLILFALLAFLLFRLLRRDDSRQELAALREEVHALRQSMKEVPK